LLDSAAAVAEQNGRRTLNMARKLSYHLHAAEDRIAERPISKEPSERSSGFTEVYAEIEDRFLR